MFLIVFLFRNRKIEMTNKYGKNSNWDQTIPNVKNNAPINSIIRIEKKNEIDNFSNWLNFLKKGVIRMPGKKNKIGIRIAVEKYEIIEYII